MSSVAMIINSRSSRNAGKVNDLVHLTSRHANLRPYVLDGIDGLDNALSDIARAKSDTLVLCGGDGTMQAAITNAINGRQFDQMPNYVALPCGMTNVIAADCGLRGEPRVSLDKFLRRRSRGEVRKIMRPLIGLQLSERQLPIYGFFLGAGLFHSAVQYSREKIQSMGAKRSLALGLSVASYIMKTALDKSEGATPLPAKISNAGGEFKDADLALLLMTTLNKLSLGIFPFWGGGDGPMNVMTIDHPPRKMFRAGVHILRGRGAPWLAEAGYSGWRTGEMRMRFDATVVFDGEIFHSNPDEDLLVKVSHRAAFLV